MWSDVVIKIIFNLITSGPSLSIKTLGQSSYLVIRHIMMAPFGWHSFLALFFPRIGFLESKDAIVRKSASNETYSSVVPWALPAKPVYPMPTLMLLDKAQCRVC